MRHSALFTKTRKEAPKDEVSKNAQLLIRAGYIHKEMAGVYSYLPPGLRVLNNIARIIREEMDEIGGQELLMSALHPLENYQATKRDQIDVLFRTELKAGGELLLGQSHEEIVVPLMKEYIASYKDLPRAVYQIQTKFRNEARAKSGIMRGREFMMKDLYSFHADEADFDVYYERAKEAYKKVYARVGLGERTYLTYASGGSFSKYSHEFQTITDAGEDTVYLCDTCKVAVNDEIIDDLDGCPTCHATKDTLTKTRTIEVGNIFPLKTRFSDAFGLTYKDTEGNEQPVVMGCYGIGLGRVMGTIVEVLSDEKGIVWPVSVAPYTYHLLSVGGDQAVKDEADTLYQALTAAGKEVLYDDRDVRAGEKFADSDLLGLPYRIVVSAKTLAAGQHECTDRRTGTTEMSTTDALCRKVVS